MKTIKDMVSDEKPKSIKKLEKAISDAGCEQYGNAFRAEALKATAMEFPKINVMITDNYFVTNSVAGEFTGKKMCIIPLAEITNVYRTNLTNNREYDFEAFYLALEMTDGSRRLFASMGRYKDVLDCYKEVISVIRSRMTSAGREV